MTIRRAFAVLLNVAAILVPTVALYARYGMEARIDRENSEFLLPLVGAMVVAFLAGQLSARLAARTSTDVSSSIFHTTVKVLLGTAESPRPHPTRRAA